MPLYLKRELIIIEIFSMKPDKNKKIKFRDFPHRRWNPLIEEWILVSPHRTKRPWQGKQEVNTSANLVKYDPKCYLCPGNIRANGEKNPNYTSTYVFKNDFSALLNSNEIELSDEKAPEYKTAKGIVKEIVEVGECRVVCFSPRHDLTLPDMIQPEIEKVIDTWVKQYWELSLDRDIAHIQIFENKGEIMGCSNPHPHCQIWAQKNIPTIPLRELESQKKYFRKNKTYMLIDYLKWEIEQKERLVYENEDWGVVVPHWAVWPFETLIIPKIKIACLFDFKDKHIQTFADAMLNITRKYDQIFQVSFPYSMGIHQIPVDKKNYDGVILHQHFFPPLLRSATVKKFMVGYEMTSEPQRDITPESAAEILRNLPAKPLKIK